MLSVADLTVHYGAIRALDDVSLDVEDGEAVGLIGPNGAGKTTLLAAVAGLVGGSAGTITMDGVPIHGRRPERIVRTGIALVPEGRRILGTLTVSENLLLGATPRKDGKRAVQDHIAAILERFPRLGKLSSMPAGKLSGGEQQQLAIARALLAKPRVLLLDEPSLGLAPLVVDEVFDVLADLRSEGMTILLVEQNAVRAVEFADRSYILTSGRVAVEGSRDDFSSRSDLVAAYMGVPQ